MDLFKKFSYRPSPPTSRNNVATPARAGASIKRHHATKRTKHAVVLRYIAQFRSKNGGLPTESQLRAKFGVKKLSKQNASACLAESEVPWWIVRGYA